MKLSEFNEVVLNRFSQEITDHVFLKGRGRARQDHLSRNRRITALCANRCSKCGNLIL